MNTYFFHLKHQLKYALPIIILSLILWLFVLSFYPMFIENKDAITNLVLNMNETLVDALEIDLNTIFTPLGYYSLFFPILAVLGSILAITLGIDLMSYDRINGYQENTCLKPISKKRLFTSRLCASMSYLIIDFLLIHVASIISLSISKNLAFSWWLLFEINFSLLLSMCVFLAIAMVIGSFVNHHLMCLYTTITILVFLLFSFFENAFHASFLKYINPYSYFEVMDIVIENSYQTRFVTISIFLFFFFICFGYGIYQHEDIKETK